MKIRTLVLIIFLQCPLGQKLLAQSFHVNSHKKFVMPTEFLTLRTSQDSTYGYSPFNPIKIGTGDSLSTQVRMFDLVFCLRTADDQVLLLENSEKILINNQIEVEAISLSTELTSKKFQLYFDTKSKFEILCPKGMVIDTLMGTYVVPYIRNNKVVRRIQE